MFNLNTFIGIAQNEEKINTNIFCIKKLKPVLGPLRFKHNFPLNLYYCNAPGHFIFLQFSSLMIFIIVAKSYFTELKRKCCIHFIYAFLLSWLSAGIFHCYIQYASLKGQAGSDVTIKDLGLQTDFSVYLQIQQTWLAFSEFLHHYVCNVQVWGW